MSNQLEAPFTKEELYFVVKNLKSYVAPGPDIIPAGFYQAYLLIVGEDITNNAIKIPNDVESPERLNHILTSLIPKIKQPSKPSHCRPIALCNAILIIVTKVLANVIKPLLPNLISENQSAFVQ